MKQILLINPNSSDATTAMMVDIARAEVPGGVEVTGISARSGPPMIVDEAELAAAGFEVERVWRGACVGTNWDGVIISAFGDPGIDLVRACCSVPVVGICEASMLEAAANGRVFGVATVTPLLVDAIDAKAEALGLAGLYTGIRLTAGDPRELAAYPKLLEDALAGAVSECIDDGALAVIIGGGPLGQAAIGLARRFDVPVIAPISAAVRLLMAQIEAHA